MKNLYLLSLIVLFLGCSKDVLIRYDKRIIGSWRISDVKRTGLGGSTIDLPFKKGATISFFADRTMTYTSPSGSVYKGNWDIQKDFENNENYQRALQLTAVDFSNQIVITEYFDEMNFRGSDHFVAFTQEGLQSYTTYFRK